MKKQLELVVDDVKHFKTERNFLKALQSPPNIVILDYNLENSTGIEMMKEIQERGIESEILFVSAQENVDVMLKAYKKGALGYFEKQSETFKEVKKCIEWILLMSNEFSYPIHREAFREIWLKRR